MKKDILDEEIKKDFLFLFYDKDLEKNIYFCDCGEVVTQNSSTSGITMDMDFFAEESDIFKGMALFEKEKVICQNCKNNLSTIENSNRLFTTESYFASEYSFEELEEDVILYYTRFKSIANKSIVDESPVYSIDFVKNTKHIRFNIVSKKLFFKDFDGIEKEFDINEIIKNLSSFFSCEEKNIYKLINLQLYINAMYKYVIDIKNTDIVNKLIFEIRNKFNNAGLENIKKTLSIFFSIIKYSNLSTIALTKGSKFLYDLMNNCKIPNSSELRENNLTSPISIFNYLIKNYIKSINEEINEDNKEVHEFLFKSSKFIKMETEGKHEVVKNFEEIDLGEEKEMKIKFFKNENYQEGKILHNQDTNKFKVFEISNDVSASKFIYNKITEFSDYKQILKYFKFYNKQQIIYLLQKYEMDLLTRVIDLIYFRDEIELKELERIITIIKDYAFQETIKYSPSLNKDNIKINFSYVEKFELIYYDDCVMMMEVLKFDPRREFNKLKTFKEFMDYHDNLVKYFSVVTNKEKNEKFKKFVNRFTFLESRKDYDGPLEIKLITSPAMLITEGVIMRHSASSYSRKVISETYVIAQVMDKTADLPNNELKRFTIGFSFDEVNGLEFHQVKGVGNEQGSDRFKKLLMEYLTVKDISFRPIKDLKLKSN